MAKKSSLGLAAAASVVLGPLLHGEITRHPVSQVVHQGLPVLLSVRANDSGPSFQWRKDGEDIPGAVGMNLHIDSVQPTDAGDYTVRVTSGTESEVSHVAALSLAPGLVAYYPFDGNAEDVSRPGKQAILANSTDLVEDPERGSGVASIQGKGFGIPPWGEPLDQQGPGGYIQIPRPTLVDGDPFTVSFFIKEEGFSLWHGESLVTMGEGASSVDLIRHYWIGSLDGTKESYGGNNVDVLPYDSTYVLNGSAVTLTAPWTAYTCVAEGTSVKIYRDTTLLGSVPYKKDTMGDFFIGRHWWADGTNYSTRLLAKVDDFRIYNRALTATEVGQLSDARALARGSDFPGPWTDGSFGEALLIGDSGYWVNQATTTIDGFDAVEGRLGGHPASETWMETTVTGPTTLYFSYRVKNLSGPYSGDFRLLVGESSTIISSHTGTWDEDTGWREFSALIPTGQQTVRWSLRYLRGASLGRAYVDQVWTSSDPRPRITDVSPRAVNWNTPVSWTVPIHSSTPATLTGTGLPPGLTIDPTTHIISGTPTQAGRFEMALTAQNGSGRHVAAKIMLEVVPGITSIPDGIDAPGLTLSQGPPGNAWRGASGIGYDGVDSARGLARPTPGLDGSVNNTLSTTFNGPGILTFWYRCESSAVTSRDKSFIFLYVGVPPSSPQTAVLEGDTWTKASVDIPEGQQTVSWKALRLTSSGIDDDVTERFVYLDNLLFVPTSVGPQTTFAAWQTAWNVADQPAATDIDADGLTLLMEYALGGSPYAANPELLPAASVVDGHLTLTLTKAPSPTDLLYFVQASKDLTPNSWTTSSVELNVNGAQLVARSIDPVSAQPASYLRVLVRVDE